MRKIGKDLFVYLFSFLCVVFVWFLLFVFLLVVGGVFFLGGGALLMLGFCLLFLQQCIIIKAKARSNIKKVVNSL